MVRGAQIASLSSRSYHISSVRDSRLGGLFLISWVPNGRFQKALSENTVRRHSQETNSQELLGASKVARRKAHFIPDPKLKTDPSRFLTSTISVNPRNTAPVAEFYQPSVAF